MKIDGQTLTAWIGAVVGVIALLGMLATAAIRIGALEATLVDNTDEIRRLRDDVRLLRDFIGGLPVLDPDRR